MGVPIIFNGRGARLLTNILKFATTGAPTLQYSAIDPNSSPFVDAPQGSLCFYNGSLYVQFDSGTAHNWLEVVLKG